LINRFYYSTFTVISASDYLCVVPFSFIVYLSPTQVTFVSKPELNPIWYPTENANAVNNNTNTTVSRKSNKLPIVLQNFSMTLPFYIKQVIPLSSFFFKACSKRPKDSSYIRAMFGPKKWATFIPQYIKWEFNFQERLLI